MRQGRTALEERLRAVRENFPDREASLLNFTDFLSFYNNPQKIPSRKSSMGFFDFPLKLRAASFLPKTLLLGFG